MARKNTKIMLARTHFEEKDDTKRILITLFEHFF